MFFKQINKMANCFETLISIKGCGDDKPPTSGLYVDDFGMNAMLCDQLITQQYSAGQDLFKAKRKAAGEMLSSEIQARLAHWMKADKVIDNGRSGYFTFNENATYTPALGVGKYAGIALRTEARKSFVNLHIADFTISTENDIVIPFVYFIDLFTGKIIHKLEDVNSNEQINLQKTFLANRNDLYIGIVYESTDNARRTVIKEGYCNDCGGRFPEVYCCRQVLSQAISGEIDLPGEKFINKKAQGFTYGMQVNYALNCDYSAWVCSNANIFALAHVFKTNAEIAAFGLFESINVRANTAVTINAEKLQELHSYFLQQYTNQMNLVLQNMAMPQDQSCFRCNQNMRWGSMIP